MPKSHKGALSNYVGRVMKEKHLSRRDVKLRSGGEITDSYVSGIVNGTATNLSIEKLKALARGLRVSERELIHVAFELGDDRHSERQSDESHNLILLDIRKKTVIGMDIAEIVQEILNLAAPQRTIVLQVVKRLRKADRSLQRKRRSL